MPPRDSEEFGLPDGPDDEAETDGLTPLSDGAYTPAHANPEASV